MPVFTRRRLQEMLDELGPFLNGPKVNDLFARLTHVNAKDAIAAEIELGLLWGISQVADLEVEPIFPTSSSRVDALSKTLLSSAPIAVEITAVSDDNFSGKEDMDRAANIIIQFAKRFRPEAEKHLAFHFNEKSYYANGRFRRVRQVSKKFSITASIENQLTAWLKHPNWPEPKSIRVTTDTVDVSIKWEKYVHPMGRTFCSMPAVAYDLEDNLIFKALKRKERQLAGVTQGTVRSIFLADAGCSMLRNLKPFNSLREVSGERVIHHFLSKSEIDIVCVFSPSRNLHGYRFDAPVRWNMTVLPRNGAHQTEYEKLFEIARRLPRPQYEAYQARSLQR